MEKHLSGVWCGESTPFDELKSATIWKECSLTFTVLSGIQQKKGATHSIGGVGTSLWKGEIIQFKIVGFYVEKTGYFEIYKTHVGKFTNTMVYEGVIVAKSNEAPVMEGTYPNGKLKLILNSSYENVPNSEILGQYAISNNNSKLVPLPFRTLDTTIPLPFELEESDSNNKSGVNIFMDSLKGTWYGDINMQSPYECIVQLTLSLGTGQGTGSLLQLIGDGFLTHVSTSVRKPMQLKGSIDSSMLVSLSISSELLVTRCLCKLWLPLDYFNADAQYLFPVGYRDSCEKNPTLACIVSNDGSCVNIVFDKRSQPILQQKIDNAAVLPASNLSSNSIHDQKSLTVLDSFVASSNLPVINPNLNKSVSNPTSMVISALVDKPELPRPNSDDATIRRNANYIEAQFSKSADINTSSNNVSSEELQMRYKAFLHGVTMDEKISLNKQASLASFRQLLGITDEEHEKALVDLGFTLSEFESRKSLADHADDDKDLCIICFDKTINCVFVPCFHMAVCLSCSAKLEICPVCRTKISESKVIYRP